MERLEHRGGDAGGVEAQLGAQDARVAVRQVADRRAQLERVGCVPDTGEPGQLGSAVRQWPEVRLTDNTAYYLRQGQPVIVPHAPTSGWVRLAEVEEDDTAKFIGVGEILDDGRVAPRRLVVEQNK